MKLSVVIPAHNEEGCIETTLRNVSCVLVSTETEHEIIVVNDHSTDKTRQRLLSLQQEIPFLCLVDNTAKPGFGMAVRCGLEKYAGDAVAIYMADGSDSPEDLVRFFKLMQKKQVDCVFGSRFMKGSQIVDYPVVKLALNRLANTFVRCLFGFRYNDITNAFKMYRRHVIDGVHPILSHHFNLTVELPLKAIVRGYRYAVLPNNWIQRKSGESKLKIKEMGSRYLFIIFYCFIEKWLSRGDYLSSRKPQVKA